MKLVFASDNVGKIAELQQMLHAAGVTIIPQSELGIRAADETGLTFVENAILKARHACQESGLAAIADDSGLAVNALNGAPGIYSARYAGENANAEKNMAKLLHDMTLIPDNERQAAFHCVLVYMHSANDPIPIICHGTLEGIILKSPQGKQGFGYDPLFFIPNENKTAAELDPDVKNSISHRGQALRLLMEQLYASTLSQKPHQKIC